MSTESDTPSPPFIPTAQPVGFIHMGKWEALVKWAEADWDSAQTALQAENQRCLYGIREFLTPDIFAVTASKTAALYIRLDRASRYLAHLIGHSLAADKVDKHTVEQRVQRQADWDHALAQYQHQSRALAWWQRCGLEEISEPGITERRRQPQPKPTIIQELEMIHQLSGHGRNCQHSHSHSAHCHCRCSRPRKHTHGHF